MSVKVEGARCKALRQVHTKLEALLLHNCGEAVCKRLSIKTGVTLRNGDATYDRWLMAAMHDSWQRAFSQQRSGATAAAAAARSVVDPLLPERAGASQQLHSELVDAGAHNADATTVCQGLVQAVQALASSVRKQGAAAARRGEAAGASKRIHVTEEDGVVTVKCGKKQRHTLSAGHYRKLQRLFECNSSRAVAAAPGSAQHQRAFHQRLAVLLQRYEALGGGGFQAACNGATFDAFHAHFGAAFECFASPLNCRYSRHVSALRS